MAMENKLQTAGQNLSKEFPLLLDLPAKKSS